MGKLAVSGWPAILTPFEAQELRTHVYFSFWKDVYPVPMVKLLQNEVHPFLIDTISSTYRHTFAQAEEMGMQLLGEADVCSCWGPTHQLQVPDVAEFQDPPEMRVIHARLVVRDGDKRGRRTSVLNELIQHFLVVHGKVVHILGPEAAVGAN